MDSFTLIQPSKEHERQYEEMMDEWELYGGRLNPGALKRYSFSQQKTVTYTEWLKWIDEDKKAGQDLFFFLNGVKIIGAISIRPKKNVQSIEKMVILVLVLDHTNAIRVMLQKCYQWHYR